MKLKVYRISLISCLVISFALTVFFLVLAIKNIIGLEKEEMMDGIMYILCFVLNLAFLGLEIGNTIYSYKTGSNFIKNLTFNEDGSLNNKLIKILTILEVIVGAVIIYFAIIYKGDKTLPLSELTPLAKSVAITFFVTVFVDMTFILLFPILGKDDPSLQLEKEKTSKI